MGPKKLPKRKVGRPRKKNRTYSGMLPLDQIAAWSTRLDMLNSLLSQQVVTMREGDMAEVHVFGREITKGLDWIDVWVAKLQSSILLAKRQSATVSSGDTQPSE